MATEIVEQLKNGVVVPMQDGTSIACRPLYLEEAIMFLDLWDVRGNPATSSPDRYQARMKMVREFFRIYPQVKGKITMADVDLVLPRFFWVESGNVVPVPLDTEPAQTGTPPSESTSPPTDGVPT